jgi:hypothetical protein
VTTDNCQNSIGQADLAESNAHVAVVGAQAPALDNARGEGNGLDIPGFLRVENRDKPLAVDEATAEAREEAAARRFAQGKRLFHPLANDFPLMAGPEFEEFVADIKAHGLRERITMFEDKILDGRNRYRACLRLKIEPLRTAFTGNEADAAAFVISRNIHRRHLTPKAKREAIAKLLKMQPEKSDRLIAKQIGVHNETVGAVRASLEARDGIRHVEKRTDSKGRQQPAKKASLKKPVKANTKTAEGTNEAKAQRDIGESSAGEFAQLSARITELHAENRRLEIKYDGLEREKAAPAQPKPDRHLEVSLTRILRQAIAPLLTARQNTEEAGAKLLKFAGQIQNAGIGLDDITITINSK